MVKRKRIAIAVLVIMFIIIALYVCISYQFVKPDKGKITEGVWVDKIEIGGMTREQALQEVAQYVTGMEARGVEISVNGVKVQTTLAEVGYQFKSDDFIDKAMAIGRDGSMIKNYVDVVQAKKKPIVFAVHKDENLETLHEYVKNGLEPYTQKAKNAKIKRKNGHFIYKESKIGVKINEEETAKVIQKEIEATPLAESISVEAQVETEQPEITLDLVKRCKDELGSYTTSFNSGNVNRSKNLANAARLLDATVVYPGKKVSVHKKISPLTEKNGYYTAPSYSKGQVVDSLGGGVCQVSTTLYNALLRAEIKILKRFPHSMVVTYVQPSMDAAIAGDYKDLVFKNNTEAPLYIESGVSNGTIFFRVYGEETRSPDRRLEFQSEVLSTTEPGADNITYDPNQPTSYVKVEQEAHQGCQAVLWKIVRENGKEEKIKVNTSSYAASPRYITKGSKDAASTTTGQPATAAPKTTTGENKKSGDSQGTTDNSSNRSSGNETDGSTGTNGSGKTGSSKSSKSSGGTGSTGNSGGSSTGSTGTGDAGSGDGGTSGE